MADADWEARSNDAADASSLVDPFLNRLQISLPTLAETVTADIASSYGNLIPSSGADRKAVYDCFLDGYRATLERFSCGQTTYADTDLSHWPTTTARCAAMGLTAADFRSWLATAYYALLRSYVHHAEITDRDTLSRLIRWTENAERDLVAAVVRGYSSLRHAASPGGARRRLGDLLAAGRREEAINFSRCVTPPQRLPSQVRVFALYAPTDVLYAVETALARDTSGVGRPWTMTSQSLCVIDDAATYTNTGRHGAALLSTLTGIDDEVLRGQHGAAITETHAIEQVPAAIAKAVHSARLAYYGNHLPTLVTPRDVLIETAVLAHPDAVDLKALLQPLSPPLINTLRRLYENDLDRAATARGLGLSRRGLSARLRRIADLAGKSPTSQHGVALYTQALLIQDLHESYPW